jgi:hypothetical protein
MMSGMAVPRSGLLLAVVAAGLVAAGCGSGGGGASVTSRPRPAPASGARGSGGPAAGSGAHAIPAPAPTGLPADPVAVRVIRAWANALRHGDVRGAARYFALPSEFINGSGANGEVVIAIHTRAEAEGVNATLPCGAVLIAADRRGRYVNALFRLTDRPGPGAGCGSGTGQAARTNFVIVGGRIVQWIRAPEDPGDNQGANARPGPGAPSTPQRGSPVV